MDISTIDCGKEQSYQQRDMSDSSQYLYGHPPPDIMPKGLSNNGTFVSYHKKKNIYIYIYMKQFFNFIRSIYVENGMLMLQA